MAMNAHDNITRCPECSATLWVTGSVLNCPCGHEFTPDKFKRFETGDEKRKRQEELGG